MKKVIIFIGFFALPMLCIGQYDSRGYDTTRAALNKELTDYAWSVKAGYISQAGSLVELGLFRQKYHQDLYYHPGEFYGTSGPSIACEINLDFDKNIIGPKVAYELYYMRFFAAKANLIYYTDFNRSALCFAPELGLSFFGFLTLSSRYCIPFYNKDLLFKNSTEAIGLSVSVNLPVAFRRSTVKELRERDQAK